MFKSFVSYIISTDLFKNFFSLEKSPCCPVQVYNLVNVYSHEDNYRLYAVYTAIKFNHAGTFSEYQISVGSRITSYWELEQVPDYFRLISFWKRPGCYLEIYQLTGESCTSKTPTAKFPACCDAAVRLITISGTFPVVEGVFRSLNKGRSTNTTL